MSIFPNTVFEYLYRDADNYQAHARLILPGHLLPSKADKLKSLRVFIPSQVGLPDLQMQMISESDDLSNDFFGPDGPDHPFHEFGTIQGSNAPPTEDLSAEELFERIVGEGKKGWDEKTAINRLKSEIEYLKKEIENEP